MTDKQSPSTQNGTNLNAPALTNDLENINNLTNYVSRIDTKINERMSFFYYCFFAKVNTIFQQMEEKFLAASDQMMSRMNELGKKIDTLETNLGEIISSLPNEASSNDSSEKNQTDTSQ